MQSLVGRSLADVAAIGRRHSPYVINKVKVKDEHKYLLLREVLLCVMLTVLFRWMCCRRKMHLQPLKHQPMWLPSFTTFPIPIPSHFVQPFIKNIFTGEYYLI